MSSNDESDFELDADFHFVENEAGMDESERDSEVIDAKQDNSHDPVWLRNITERFTHLQKKVEEIDSLATQLKLASSLQKCMADCYSNRLGKLPIEVSCENRCLSSGSILYLLCLRNNSSYELRNWYLSVSWTTAAPQDPSKPYSVCSSQCHSIGVLMPGEVHTTEMLISYEEIHLPLIAQIQIMRAFNIGSLLKWFRIELDSKLLSFCDFLTILNEPLLKQLNFAGSSSLRLPCALADLLCGCPDDDDPANVLRIILPSNCVIEPGTTSAYALLAHNSDSKHIVMLSVVKKNCSFIITVSVRDTFIRSRLYYDLRLLLIMKASSVFKRPKTSIECLPNYTSIDELYNSIIANFDQ